MRKIVVTISLCFFVSVYSFAQINVSIKNDCLMCNSAIISKAMIEILGEDSIKCLLNNNIRIIFISLVDSLGYISKIEKIRPQQELVNNCVTKIEKYLITNRIRFYICYVKDPPDIPEDHIIAYAREYFKNNRNKLINFAFPGELMNLYEYEKEKAKEKGLCLSKYDYLLKQINRFL